VGTGRHESDVAFLPAQGEKGPTKNPRIRSGIKDLISRAKAETSSLPPDCRNLSSWSVDLFRTHCNTHHTCRSRTGHTPQYTGRTVCFFRREVGLRLLSCYLCETCSTDVSRDESTGRSSGTNRVYETPVHTLLRRAGIAQQKAVTGRPGSAVSGPTSSGRKAGHPHSESRKLLVTSPALAPRTKSQRRVLDVLSKLRSPQQTPKLDDEQASRRPWVMPCSATHDHPR
jgi:hypothetical protein